MNYDMPEFFQRAAGRIGYVRERFEDQRIPNDPASVTIMPFFGDIRSLFVVSSLLLKRYREEMKGSKYFVLCSWPGCHTLFPYVDEYWTIPDDSQVRKLYHDADGFRNRSDLYTVNLRSLHEFFRDVADSRDLEPYYHQGITQGYWDRFRHVKRFLPMVPSSTLLGKEFNRELATKAGYKIFLFPSLEIQSWRHGRTKNIPVSREFWLELVQRLLEERYVPVLWKHPLGYDLSSDFSEDCVHLAEKDLSKVLATIRATGMVLDIFNGSSRLAIAARTPYLCCDERARYMAVKEFEIDDLCGPEVPRQYIFSFSTIIEGGGRALWSQNLFGNIATRLKEFLPELNRDTWPTTGESTDIVPYDTVRKRKAKSFGVKLLRVPKEG